MPRTKPPQRLFRIHREGPYRFVIRGDNAQDSPYGVDRDINTAIGSARREAALARRAGCRVVVEVEQPDGKWKREFAVDPTRR